ncbi:MAG: malto-oligosyltrehalose synthase [Acidimicrobiales bacterium]|nr:malto-oligosyltrehalose synthase [Acidimicrobiales bacterium]
MAGPEVAAPRATYRVQLRPEFGFEDAAAVVEYLAALGVSHLYASPYLQAAPGSTHGYDVIDHAKVNDELGGDAGHRRMIDALGRAGLGQVVDLVPNHMAIGPRGNRWWWDVLENGRSSRFAGHFDVDWDPPGESMRNRVLMPILGDHYGRALERGEITVGWSPEGRFVVSYYDHVLPSAPRSLDSVLLGAAERCDSSGADHLAFIGSSLARLPSLSRDPGADVVTRHRDKEVLYQQLARLAGDDPTVVEAVRDEIRALNADVDALDRFLDRQNYRLAYWRTADDELGYRRFFDINTLVGLRVEDAEVFADTHRLVLGWLAADEVDGLRIDHPDGLRDPQAYFELLRAAAPGTWIVVEKILEPGESLPRTWPVDGTTGYDFCHLVTRLLHDPRGEEPIRTLYDEVTGDSTPFPEVVRAAKDVILQGSLASDVARVTDRFVAVGQQHRRWRDFTRRELRDALVEVATSFPVYRTYVGPDAVLSGPDSEVIDAAIADALAHRPDLDPELFEILGAILRGELDPGPGPATELRLRFQQLTGPVMAKGVEDTAFYDHVPLGSLNEVGSDPATFAIDPGSFHDAMAEAVADRPASMLALSTHDTKRSEDVRARLALLSEIPGAWSEAVHRWRDLVDRHRAVGDGVDGWPDPRMEHLLFQTLVGAHPLPASRASEYLAKAVREAKRNTSWTEPNAGYDEAVDVFVAAVCDDPAFRADLDAFVEPLLVPGWTNALAQKLVQLTAPGVPDIYQGTELWDLSLVDPDNRRPVDFAHRRSMLAELDSLPVEEVWRRVATGLPKLLVVARTLALRRAHPGWFADGGYEPLSAAGAAAAHLVAYRRGDRAITVVPRLPVGLVAGGGWRDTVLQLPAGAWHDAFAGAEWEGGDVPVTALLERFPVALLYEGEEQR